MIFMGIIGKLLRSKFTLFNLLVFLVTNLYSQTYILNEDFSSANGTIPPTGWTNTNITGVSTDVWHFNNPGNRAPGFPMIGTFAIFDSENYSQSGGPEKAQIESPSVDCSFSTSILMYFDHYFVGGNGGSGKIEVYDGTNWNIAANYTDSTVGVESVLLDISSFAGGITNAKVRLEWEGDSSYYWAVDNIQIYAPYDTTVFDTVCDGYSYNFNGTLLSSAGTYYDTLTAVNSLDSIITLNLSLNNSVTYNLNTNLCTGDSLLLQGGYQTIAGTYYDTIISGAASGCDSIVVTNLTILPILFSDTVFATACDSLIWEGSTYTRTGIYNDTLASVNGCDSILTLNLSINNTTSTNDSLVACDSVIWNGNTYTLSGVYTDTLQTVSGCDSVVNMDLTINISSTLSITSNDSLICYGDSVQLIASGAQSYSWQTSYNISSNSVSNPFVYPLIDTSYVLTATDLLGCSSNDTILISVIPPYLLDLGGTIDTCIGSSFSIQATLLGGIVNNNSLSWKPSIYFNDPSLLNPIFQSDSSVMVYLNVSDTIEGCQVSDSLIININNPIADAGNDLDTCYGTSLILNGSGAGIGGSYLWAPSNSINHATIANPLTVLDSNIQFILQVSDSIGCTDNDTVQISVFSSSFLSDTSLCEGDSLNIELYVDTFNNPSFSCTPTNGLSASNTNSITIYTDSTNTYSYLATANNGCIFSDTITVIINNANAVIDTALLTGCEGVTMVFENISDESLNYYWIIDKTDSLFEVSQEIFYAFGERVQTDLYVENTFGCYDSTSLDFYLKGFDDYFTITDPNVFTPNGDGENDEFIIDIPEKVQPCAELVIYNKWGQIQYFSVGYNLKWDGRNNVGSLAPSGTYFYTLNIKDEIYSGKLQLFR